jgi:biotin carboxyl carrier protein
MSGITPQELDAFLQVFEASAWDQVDVVIGDWALRVAKAGPAVPGRVRRLAVAAGSDPAHRQDWVEIQAPHVATFRRVAEEGAQLRQDSAVCLLEVMRTVTPLAAGVEGIVRRIYVAEGDLVEAEQPLFLVEPCP